jgi:hypothetical protein
MTSESVQYNIFYKYVNPDTKKVTTNDTTDVYDSTTRYIGAYNNNATTTNTMTTDIINQESASNTKYDMIFYFDGTQDITDVINTGLVATGGIALPSTDKIINEKFSRCLGECWFFAGYRTSLYDAINVAKPLIQSLGLANVKVLKNVPLDLSIALD